MKTKSYSLLIQSTMGLLFFSLTLPAFSAENKSKGKSIVELHQILQQISPGLFPVKPKSITQPPNRSLIDNVRIPVLPAMKGTPLKDAIKFLADSSRKADPTGRGINFRINPFIVPPHRGLDPIPDVFVDAPELGNDGLPKPPDPNAGGAAPLNPQPRPTLAFDPARTRIRHLDWPAHNLTLRQALELICRHSTVPLRYVVEEHGITILCGTEFDRDHSIRIFSLNLGRTR
jgi:hypothetical protein